MQLVGWAWAEGTHSWLEPTAFAVLALQAAGQSNHARTREAVRLILDRQLPGGGCNYGNTVVLGQRLRPHVQPTGIALLALAGENDSDVRITKSIAWLRRSIGPETTAASLAWALLGLRAHGIDVPQADDWFATAAEHTPRGVAARARPAGPRRKRMADMSDTPTNDPIGNALRGVPADVQPPQMADRRRHHRGSPRRSGARPAVHARAGPVSASLRTRPMTDASSDEIATASSPSASIPTP